MTDTNDKCMPRRYAIAPHRRQWAVIPTGNGAGV
jgi:hypothetical protein